MVLQEIGAPSFPGSGDPSRLCGRRELVAKGLEELSVSVFRGFQATAKCMMSGIPTQLRQSHDRVITLGRALGKFSDFKVYDWMRPSTCSAIGWNQGSRRNITPLCGVRRSRPYRESKFSPRGGLSLSEKIFTMRQSGMFCSAR